MLRKKLKLSENVSEAVEKDETGLNPSEEIAENTENQTQFTVTFEMEFWEKIWQIEQNLVAELEKIDFKKDKNIAAVYNPLDYAADVHKNFMRMYLKKAPKILFLGMNPGLFGMCQTSASFFLVNDEYLMIFMVFYSF